MGLTPEETINYFESLDASNAIIASKKQAINENLPSWSQVETSLDAISTLAEAKVALKKMARVVYWLAKGRAD